MTIGRRDFLKLSGLAATSATVGGSSLGQAIHWTNGWLATSPTYAAEIAPQLHALNRLTWAARPEDVNRIGELGIEGYIDWQLAPEDIPDPRIDAFMKTQPILSMSISELLNVSRQKDGDTKIIETVIWARLVRAAFSERQLYELMVEFWSDHFNIPIPDLSAGKAYDDRLVVRQHAMGKFRDLLLASAQSPAMIVYLNNDANEKDHPNENYAREVMELHTLGVDGGYTEKDVKAVARAFTGWTVRDGKADPFFFNADAHDQDAKTILGHTLAGGRGIEDPLAVLDILATHSATARFISRKLVRRFVSDIPPQSLVESTGKVFADTEGDIRKVMRHIFTSSEFMAARGVKFRRPVDYIVAAIRVTRAGFDDPSMLGTVLEEMGQIPFFWHPPNGYPDAARAWLNTNAVLNRWNFALQFTDPDAQRENKIHMPIDKLIPVTQSADELVNRTLAVVLAGPIVAADRDQLIAYVNADGGLTSDNFPVKRAVLLGLVLASPYFQWH